MTVLLWLTYLKCYNEEVTITTLLFETSSFATNGIRLRQLDLFDLFFSREVFHKTNWKIFYTAKTKIITTKFRALFLYCFSQENNLLWGHWFKEGSWRDEKTDLSNHPRISTHTHFQIDGAIVEVF